jgi:hypothetical protein
MNYGDIALGVECALPAVTPSPRRSSFSRVRRLLTSLAAALRRWA